MSETSLFEKTVETHWGYALREGVSIEDLYQAFKKRLVAELSQGGGAVVLVPLNVPLTSPPTEGR